ncbi:putative phospholipase A1 magnifin [Sarcoptes scabiei]|uniref:Putative phospholipase A1 magnifin n=1 Tax=Sarcoptes scabiei TaxID=52283 RepID=A0A834RID7_SARSC|nr:putative phospholipase A1 magnifin [Sarcoptes scabiei]
MRFVWRRIPNLIEEKKSSAFLMAAVKPMPKTTKMVNGKSNSNQSTKSNSNKSKPTPEANLFQPMSLEEIQPELVAYGPNGDMLTISHDVSSKKAFQMLKEANLLEFPRIVFMVHGFWGSSKSKWIHDLKQKFLEESDQTFVIVGWGKGAELPAFKYPQAVANVEPVARWFSNHVLELKRKNITKNISKGKIWGIGEGIGAHIVGLAGRWSQHAFDRITGLDPAGPGFELVNEDLMLRSDDSPFVDVCHTDSHHEYRSPELYSLINKYGTLKPCGTLDIYVNFGYNQPNAPDFTNAGSHLRAIELFAWSIENPGELRTQFQLRETPAIDKPVEKTKRVVVPAELGYYADPKATGNYYLETNSEEPWKEGF